MHAKADADVPTPVPAIQEISCASFLSERLRGEDGSIDTRKGQYGRGGRAITSCLCRYAHCCGASSRTAQESQRPLASFLKLPSEDRSPVRGPNADTMWC